MLLNRLSRRHRNRPFKPWMTKGLIISRDHKFDLYEKVKFSDNPDIYNEYKRYLNIFTNVKQLAHNLYYREKAALYGHDKAKTWNLINELSNRKKKKGKNIQSIRDKQGNLLKDRTEMANCYNEHFATIGKDMASKHEDPSADNDLKDPITIYSIKTILPASKATAHRKLIY